MAYERINWQNGESGNTPLNANNLNRMDMTLEEHDQKIGDHDYEIENLKTGEQGITEELNKKMDRINPQGSGTLSIPAVNADNINAQTVEADEIKVTKVGSKGGTAPVVFDNDILVNGITTPIGSLASSASAKAESAERIANEADREAGTAKTTASTAYSRVQENIFRTDKLEGIVGGGVGESIPQYTYYDGKYLRPDGEIANYNDSARVIEFEINKNSDSGCNIIFKNVDLIPTEFSILCGFYNAAGILLAEEMRGLIVTTDFDEDTGKMTRQYISNCVVPAPYYAKYVRISGIANGVVDIAIQNTLSDAVAELQSRSSSSLVLTNPSPLPATDGKKILGIDALGKSWQDGTPTPENVIPITDANPEVIAIGKNLLDVSKNTDKRIILDNGSINTNDSACASDFIELKNGQYTFTSKKTTNNGTVYIRVHAYDADKNWMQMIFKSTNAYTASGNYSGTFTMPTNAKYIRICWYRDYADSQLELGTTATSYIPYQSNSVSLPFEPKSVGSVANEFIINEDGTGKIVQRVHSKEFNGTESWTTRTTSSGWKLFELENAMPNSSMAHDSNSALVMSNQYSAKVTLDANNTIRVLGGGKIGLRDDSVADLATFKSRMASNNLVVYCDLATPIEKTLTADEVAAVRQLMTYKGTTTIESEMDVKSVTYSGDVKAYVDGFHTYSTTPTICGYEEDGTPIYKVKIRTTTPSSPNTDKFVDYDISNIKIKRLDGTIDTSTYVFPINFFFSTTYNATAYVVNARGIALRVGSSDYTNKPCEIIIEYTLKNSAPAAASVLSLDETEE